MLIRPDPVGLKKRRGRLSSWHGVKYFYWLWNFSLFLMIPSLFSPQSYFVSSTKTLEPTEFSFQTFYFKNQSSSFFICCLFSIWNFHAKSNLIFIAVHHIIFFSFFGLFFRIPVSSKTKPFFYFLQVFTIKHHSFLLFLNEFPVVKNYLCIEMIRCRRQMQYDFSWLSWTFFWVSFDWWSVPWGPVSIQPVKNNLETTADQLRFQDWLSGLLGWARLLSSKADVGQGSNRRPVSLMPKITKDFRSYIR